MINPIVQWAITVALSLVSGGLAGAIYSNWKVNQREARARNAHARQVFGALQTELARNIAIAGANYNLHDQQSIPVQFQTNVVDEILYGPDHLALPETLLVSLAGIAVDCWNMNAQIKHFEAVRVASYGASGSTAGYHVASGADMASSALRQKIVMACGPTDNASTIWSRLENVKRELGEFLAGREARNRR